MSPSDRISISASERHAIELVVRELGECAIALRAWDRAVAAADLDGIAAKLAEELAER
jgi:hypothetical protein